MSKISYNEIAIERSEEYHPFFRKNQGEILSLAQQVGEIS